MSDADLDRHLLDIFATAGVDGETAKSRYVKASTRDRLRLVLDVELAALRKQRDDAESQRDTPIRDACDLDTDIRERLPVLQGVVQEERSEAMTDREQPPGIPPPSDAIALAANLVRTACSSELIDHYDAYDECQRFAELMRTAAVFIREQDRRCHAAEQELARIRDLVRERLGRVTCPECNGNKTCPANGRAGPASAHAFRGKIGRTDSRGVTVRPAARREGRDVYAVRHWINPLVVRITPFDSRREAVKFARAMEVCGRTAKVVRLPKKVSRAIADARNES